MADLQELLIGEVAKYPWVYDTKHKSYRDAYKRRNSWDKIQRELGLPPDEVKKTTSMWSSLRDGYSRRKKLMKAALPSGSGRDAADEKATKVKWPYFAAIDSFLSQANCERSGEDSLSLRGNEGGSGAASTAETEVIETDTTTTATQQLLVDENGVPLRTTEDLVVIIEDGSDQRDMDPVKQTPPDAASEKKGGFRHKADFETPSAKRRRRASPQRSNPLQEVQEQMLDVMKRRQAKDEATTFGELVAHNLRRMSRQRANQVKLFIMNLLYKDMEGAE